MNVVFIKNYTNNQNEEGARTTTEACWLLLMNFVSKFCNLDIQFTCTISSEQILIFKNSLAFKSVKILKFMNICNS